MWSGEGEVSGGNWDREISQKKTLLASAAAVVVVRIVRAVVVAREVWEEWEEV